MASAGKELRFFDKSRGIYSQKWPDGSRKLFFTCIPRDLSKTQNLYTHLATEQSALLLYLEAIEGNIMNTIAGTESEYIWPLMERVIRGATDSLMGRRMTSDVLERMADAKVPEYKQVQVNNEYSEDREREVVRVSREVLAAIKLDRKVSKRPELSVAPMTAIPAGKPKPSS